MNAVEILKEDHRVVDALFKKIEDTTPSKYPPIFAKIKNELDTHAHIEETVFYPRLKKDGKKDLVDIVLEGIEEHGQIKKFLREIDSLTAKNEKFEPKIKVLIEDTRHHVKEEENEMFPLVEDQFTAVALEKLGEKMLAEKEKYQKANGITPRKPVDESGMLATIAEGARQVVTDILDAGTENADGKSKKSAKSSVNGQAASSNSNKKTTSTIKTSSASKKSPTAKAEAAAK